ncbi:MAG: hypothetical protein ACK6CU_24795, partial [Deltaproteobacteria bacterium]
MSRARLALLFALGLSRPALVAGLAVERLEATHLAASERALAESRGAAAARTLEEARAAATRGAAGRCAEGVSYT